MHNIIGYMIFIVIILFIHLLVISIQLISSKDYFYGVYIKNIEIDDNFKSEIDKGFKSTLNKALFIIILIYFIIKFLFILNTSISILSITCVYLFLAYINLKKAYMKVKEYKNEYINEHNMEINKNYDKLKCVYKNEELTLIQSKIIQKFKVLFGI